MIIALLILILLAIVAPDVVGGLLVLGLYLAGIGFCLWVGFLVLMALFA